MAWPQRRISYREALGTLLIGGILSLNIPVVVWYAGFFKEPLTATTMTATVQVPEGAHVFRGEQQILASVANLTTLAEFQARTDHPQVMLREWFRRVDVIYVGRAADENGIFGIYKFTDTVTRDPEGRYVADFRFDEETDTLTTHFRGQDWWERNTFTVVIGSILAIILMACSIPGVLAIRSYYWKK